MGSIETSTIAAAIFKIGIRRSAVKMRITPINRARDRALVDSTIVTGTPAPRRGPEHFAVRLWGIWRSTPFVGEYVPHLSTPAHTAMASIDTRPASSHSQRGFWALI